MGRFHLAEMASFSYNQLLEKPPLWVTHTLHWTTVLERSFPHIKGYIISDEKKLCDATAFLPIYRLKRTLGRNCWVSIPYATISDPLADNPDSIKALFRTLLEHPLTKNCSIEVRTSTKLPPIPNFKPCTGYIQHQIILNDNEKEIFKRFHKKSVQQRIRQAITHGLKLKIGKSLDDVSVFYQIYIRMRKEQGLPPQPYSFFKNMWQQLYPINNLELLLAEKDGEIIAGCWALKNRWLYSFEYLARAARSDKLRCAYFLNWHGVRRAIQEGISIVSFARTSIKNTGLNAYKCNWGTVEVPYYDLTYPIREIHREDRFMYKVIKKCSSKLPLPLFRLLGEAIYRII